MFDKAKDFINSNGYSYKSFFAALPVFPPASLIIAWKIPDISIVIRILLTVVAVVLPLSPLLVGWLGFSQLA